jgi:hypothetical protein
VDPLAAVRWAWRAIEWLIEQGIEDVWAGGERIRAEATKLVGLEALTKRAVSSSRDSSNGSAPRLYTAQSRPWSDGGKSQ